MGRNRDLLTLSEVEMRANSLRSLHQATTGSRHRIRAIMDGGPEAIRALVGSQVDLGSDEEMPAANLMFSGIERLAQKLQDIPMIRVLPPSHKDDKVAAKRRAAKIERIVETYDEISRLELQMLEMARKVPGYGFGVWILREKELDDRNRYPVCQLRDSFNAYPGYWGPDQQPKDLATVRRVPASTLRRLYPKHKSSFEDRDGPGITGTEAWDSKGLGQGFVVVDYLDLTGSYTYVEDVSGPGKGALLLEAIPNPLMMPRFVIPHRPSFNRLVGQFDHIVGIMAMMAKLNVISAVALEDGINTETNIFGQLRGNEYEKGRFAVNEFEVNARVEKPVTNIPYQAFEQIDRLERQLRLTSGYPITDDAESPNSFVTGRGLEELGAGASRLVSEYQKIFHWALQDLDTLRLQWDEEYYGNRAKPLFGVRDGVPFSESYRPSSDIKGQYTTRRIYGMMAGWDEPTKIVTGIQLQNNGIIDTETFQENLRGLENLPQVNRRIRKKAIEGQMLGALSEMFAQGDPRASMTLVDMYVNPDGWENALRKFFTPQEQEPQPTPEEQAMIEQAGFPEPIAPGVAPPVSTVLSQLELGGEAQGGSQVVNVNR